MLTAYGANGCGQLASLTGGGELANPLAAFDPGKLPYTAEAHEIWQPLLLLAALLFPLDVAIRRLVIGSGDLRKARVWLLEHRPLKGRGLAERPRMLGQLFQARQRAWHRRTGDAGTPNLIQPIPPADQPGFRLDQAGSTPATPESPSGSQAGEAETTGVEKPDGDALSRLREAKKRARREG